MRLMADVTQYLNNSADFNDIDPNADWEKVRRSLPLTLFAKRRGHRSQTLTSVQWTTRRPEMSLYFAAITDVTEASSVKGTKCALRAVLDGVPQAHAPHRPRLIIDYVHTRAEARGAGLASLLVDFVKAAARSFGANTYVLATEDACVYWLGAGFVLESGANITARVRRHARRPPCRARRLPFAPVAHALPAQPARATLAQLRVFPDCHLLRRLGDPDDPGSADDLELALEEGEEGEEEGEENEAADGQGGAMAGGTGGDGGGGADAEDAELQAALAASLADGNHRGRVAAPVDLEDRELQAAINASLVPATAAPILQGAEAVTRGGSQQAAIVIDGDGEEDGDEDELQAAIALSLEQ